MPELEKLYDNDVDFAVLLPELACTFDPKPELLADAIYQYTIRNGVAVVKDNVTLSYVDTDEDELDRLADLLCFGGY